MISPDTAPAAHLVTVQGVAGGQLVGHLLCRAQPVYVPNMPNVDYVLAVDIAQAVVNHVCVDPVEDPEAGWVTP